MTTDTVPAHERVCTNHACDWVGPAAACRRVEPDAVAGRTMAVYLCPKCETPGQAHRAVDPVRVLFFDRDGNGPNVVNLWIEEVRGGGGAPRSLGLRFEIADSFPVPPLLRAGGFNLGHADAVKLRDALTAAIDAPRLAARATATIVASAFADPYTVDLLHTSHGEWGMRTTGGPEGQTEWFISEQAARVAFTAEVKP